MQSYRTLSTAVLRALGQGSLAILATLLIAQWFVRYRGRAMAMVQLGGAASNAVFPLLANAMIVAIDWRNAYRMLGVVVWALILPAAILVVRNRPEDVGLHPDGLPQPMETTPVQGQPVLPPAHSRVWRTSRFWLLALPTTAGPFIMTALIFHQASIFASHGLPSTVAASMFVPMAIASALTSAITGMLIDRVGPKMMLFATLGLLLLALVEIQFVWTPLGAIFYALTLGAASGTQGVTMGVIWAHYYGRTGLGGIQGAASLVTISASALAPLPLAALQDSSGGYTLALGVFTLVPLLCAAILTRFRPPAVVTV